MVQVSLVGYLAGGSFLYLAYADFPYNLLIIAVILHKYLAGRESALAATAEVCKPFYHRVGAIFGNDDDTTTAAAPPAPAPEPSSGGVAPSPGTAAAAAAFFRQYGGLLSLGSGGGAGGGDDALSAPRS